jgi:hypothetical protein
VFFNIFVKLSLNGADTLQSSSVVLYKVEKQRI